MRSGAPHGEGAPVAPTELKTAVGWLDGLAAGLILPSDVASRLDTQHPEMAKVVRAAWGDLRSSGSQARLHDAVGWIDGLAAGAYRSDVISRLGGQDPAMAKIVTATWAHLAPSRASRVAIPSERKRAKEGSRARSAVSLNRNGLKAHEGPAGFGRSFRGFG